MKRVLNTFSITHFTPAVNAGFQFFLAHQQAQKAKQNTTKYKIAFRSHNLTRNVE